MTPTCPGIRSYAQQARIWPTGTAAWTCQRWIFLWEVPKRHGDISRELVLLRHLEWPFPYRSLTSGRNKRYQQIGRATTSKAKRSVESGTHLPGAVSPPAPSNGHTNVQSALTPTGLVAMAQRKEVGKAKRTGLVEEEARQGPRSGRGSPRRFRSEPTLWRVARWSLGGRLAKSKPGKSSRGKGQSEAQRRRESRL